MTYGQSSSELRRILTDLLAMRYPYFAIGGPHPHRRENVDPEAVQFRADHVQRYRAVLWRYLVDLTRAAANDRPKQEPPRRMLRWLEAGGPSIETLPGARLADPWEMGTRRDTPFVELWRQAACTAFTARERDLTIVIDRLLAPQKIVVLKDVADFATAIVQLDDRCSRFPGWRHLGRSTTGASSRAHPSRPRTTGRVVGLLANVRNCARWADARIEPSGYEIDLRGAHPRPMLTPRPHPDGVEGAIAALRNAALYLTAGAPSASVLRTLVRLHGEISVTASQLAGAAGDIRFARAFADRSERYRQLFDELINLAGTLGTGPQVLDEVHVGMERMNGVSQLSTAQLERLSAVFRFTDDRVSWAVHRGVAKHLYFAPAGTQLGTVPGPGGIRRCVPRHVAVTKDVHPRILVLATDLRPEVAAPEPSRSHVRSRLRFAELVNGSSNAVQRSRAQASSLALSTS
ncbi:hypothetical protein [Isoptericola nanjingensis]|uniref:hypothetical protein n=1 Tax=Isoptericola nanjingensis TaxID=903413 RepID=UPI003D200026